MSLLLTAANLFAGEAKAPWQMEWDRPLEAANKEGKLVAGIPASADLRKAIGEAFKNRFPGIELDLTSSRGPTNASKIAAEHTAGVRYFDLLISGTSTPRVRQKISLRWKKTTVWKTTAKTRSILIGRNRARSPTRSSNSYG
jgi:hypothetical protein